MRRLTTLLALILLTLTTHSQAADFGLLDHRGQFHQLSRYAEKSQVALLAVALDNSDSMQRAEEFAERCDALADSGVVCLLLNSVDDMARIRALLHTPGDLPMLADTAQVVARTLQVEKLGQLLQLNPVNQRPLEFAQPLLPAVSEQASDLQYRFIAELADRDISYQDEIAPLLQQRCAYCHIEGGLAPWAMSRYLMVMGWSPMMRETLLTRRMPPGQIDNAVGHWQDTHELTDAEMALLVEWIDRGALRQGDADPLLDQPPIDTDWQRGRPDLVVDIPEQQLPATGNVDFLLKRIPLGLQSDQWLTAIAYQVGNASVLHSVLVYAVDSGVSHDNPAAWIDPAHAEYISVYVPGEPDDVFAYNSAFLLQADKDLVVKVRYLTSGRETSDLTRLGLYFQQQAPAGRLQTLSLVKENFAIAPGDAEHTETLISEPLPSDFLLENYSPHAHSRGRSMQLSVLHENGEEQPLINVANFNYNWQYGYRPSQQVVLPAGARLKAVTTYDNSPANPFNPEPEREIGAGFSDRYEMFSHFVRMVAH